MEFYKRKTVRAIWLKLKENGNHLPFNEFLEFNIQIQENQVNDEKL